MKFLTTQKAIKSEYTAHIYGIVYSKNGELQGKNRTELKAIAAELETVKKRLECL